MEKLSRLEVADKFEIINWMALRSEDPITILYNSGASENAVIDEVSGEGEVIWVRYTDLALRKLVHKSEAVGLYGEPTAYEVGRVAALVQPTAVGGARISFSVSQNHRTRKFPANT
jgi:hypothetical protein